MMRRSLSTMPIISKALLLYFYIIISNTVVIITSFTPQKTSFQQLTYPNNNNNRDSNTPHYLHNTPQCDPRTSILQRQRQHHPHLYMNKYTPPRPLPTPPSTQEIIEKRNRNIPIIAVTVPPKNVYQDGAPVLDIRYSDFLKLVTANRIEKVTFSADGTKLVAMNVDTGIRIKIDTLPNDPDLVPMLTLHKVDVTMLPLNSYTDAPYGIILRLVRKFVFPLTLMASLFFLVRKSGGTVGPGRLQDPMNFGKAKSTVELIPDTGVTFEDVAGCDGAKNELAEVVDFIQHSDAYTKNGCRIPRGVILDGPPGTGKTLLAKAVAGEAGVPFISISGSEFVEMFVGVGASRVRDIYSQAKKNTPCIIFIDEIDAVGRQRGAGFAGGNDEREQTINQILVEMDGFDGNPGVITIAATNRIDVLDQALLRPGRFDRKITVDLPDYRGRGQVLAVHARNKPLEVDVDLDAIARRTPGFSGAQLENLMNEAAISAARNNKTTIGWEEVDSAVDRLMVGLEKRRGTSINAHTIQQNELIAYHEAGHAIVGALMPDYDQVQKITIIPRSNGAGGLTFFAPTDSRLESGMYSRQYLESNVVVALGGRLAEEIVFGEDQVTTGASNDIQQVATIARRMVKQWGMSSKVGCVVLEDSSSQSGGPFMGRMLGTRRTHWGSKISMTVDDEIERIVNNSYLTAKKILDDNRPLLDHLARTLVEQETVSAEEFQIMLVLFQANTVHFGTMGEERHRDKLPFQTLESFLPF